MWRYVFPSVKVGLALLAGDVIGLYLAFNLSHTLYIKTGIESGGQFSMIVIPLSVLVMYLGDTYRVELENWGIRLVARTLVAVAVAAGVAAAFAYLTKSQESDPLFWRTTLLGGYAGFAVFAVVSRLVLSTWAQWRQRSLRWLVVGSGECARFLQNDFEKAGIRGELDFIDSGVDSKPGDTGPGISNLIGGLERLDKMEDDYSGVIIASDGVLPDTVISRLMRVRLSGVRIYDLTDFYETFFSKVPVLHLRDGWFALSHGFDLLHPNMHLKVKRMFDFVLAAILGLLLVPLLAMVSLLVLAERKGPVIYSQMRTGVAGKPFRLLKFRTMVKDAECQGPQWTRVGDPRITAVGRILRVTRLDELLQLWNVLRGDMSFIGPRPERPEFIEKLEKEIPYYEFRHVVKPGITGWAQVMYPYGSSVEDARHKLQYDLYYIKNYSLFLDLLIAIKTVRVVVFGKGR